MIDNCLETFELGLSRRSQDLKERRQGMGAGWTTTPESPPPKQSNGSIHKSDMQNRNTIYQKTDHATSNLSTA
jgi:hypothetical protein